MEPAPHNHVGPTDAAKGQSCHGEHANIAENERLGVHFIVVGRKGANVTENARSHINCRKCTAKEEPAPENHFGPTDASQGRTGYAENDKTRQNRKKARQERQIKTNEANTK